MRSQEFTGKTTQEAIGDKTDMLLIDYMKVLKEKGELEFKIENGMITSINGIENPKSGTIGDIGCTSFFPSKNLGCFGDGGAMFTNNAELAEKLHCIANHGQKVKYHHSMIGCNSRLDTLQAAVLDVKLKHLDEYIASRFHYKWYLRCCLPE